MKPNRNIVEIMLSFFDMIIRFRVSGSNRMKNEIANRSCVLLVSPSDIYIEIPNIRTDDIIPSIIAEYLIYLFVSLNNSVFRNILGSNIDKEAIPSRNRPELNNKPVLPTPNALRN